MSTEYWELLQHE